MLYIPLGGRCQSTFLIKELGFRTQAFPFDWITSPIDSLVKCIATDFEGFHQTLQLEQNAATGVYSQITDTLGFRFHHDYPTTSMSVFTEENEVSEDPIVDNWRDFHAAALEKYGRRIQRFRDAMRGPEEVVGVCRRPLADCVRIRAAIAKTYGRDLRILTDTHEVSNDPMIETVHSERDWYDIERWKFSVSSGGHSRDT